MVSITLGYIRLILLILRLNDFYTKRGSASYTHNNLPNGTETSLWLIYMCRWRIVWFFIYFKDRKLIIHLKF